MISFANLHDDIGNDLFDHKEQLNRLDEFHYPRFKEGNMKFSTIVCCFSGTESWQDMQECIVYANDCIHSSKHFSFNNDKDIQVFIAVEGMCGIKEDVTNKIQWLYNHNVRLGSLCWNDDNALACGARTNNKPLTDLGIEAIQAMNHIGIAIDTSHCCEWNFYDIAKTSTKPIIASHSNVKALYNHYRNLSDLQLDIIRNKQGLVGGIPVRWFVKNKKENATLDDFIEILKYLKEKIGIEHIALGFDFMDYIPGMEDSNVVGMKNITEIQNIALKLKENEFTDEEINAICFNNAYSFMQNYL